MFICGWKKGSKLIKENKLEDFEVVWVDDKNEVHMTPGIEKELKIIKQPTPGPYSHLDACARAESSARARRSIDGRRDGAIARELGGEAVAASPRVERVALEQLRRGARGPVRPQIAPASRRVTARAIAASSMPRAHSSSRIARTARRIGAGAQIDRDVDLAAEPRSSASTPTRAARAGSRRRAAATARPVPTAAPRLRDARSSSASSAANARGPMPRAVDARERGEAIGDLVRPRGGARAARACGALRARAMPGSCRSSDRRARRPRRASTSPAITSVAFAGTYQVR